MATRLEFDVASAAYGAEADSISGAIVTVKKCHRQTFRRFLTGVPSGRIAVSYTKRRRGLTSDDASANALDRKVLVPTKAPANGGGAAAATAPGGTWLAPSSNQQIGFGTINGPRH
jgi:hypothetical protein